MLNIVLQKAFQTLPTKQENAENILGNPRILNVFILNGSLMVGKIFNLLGQLFNSIGQILFAVNVQISNKHLVTLVPTQ